MEDYSTKDTVEATIQEVIQMTIPTPLLQLVLVDSLLEQEVIMVILTEDITVTTEGIMVIKGEVVPTEGTIVEADGLVEVVAEGAAIVEEEVEEETAEAVEAVIDFVLTFKGNPTTSTTDG